MPRSIGLHSLDDDVTHLICSHLSAYDLSSLAATSTLCRALASRDTLWQSFTPCSSGNARRNYLRSVAWNNAKAAHNVSTTESSASIHTIHLIPHAVLCASLGTSQPSAVRTSSASFFSARRECNAQCVPLCAAFSDDVYAPFSYLATAYSDASVKLFCISQQTRAYTSTFVAPPPFATPSVEERITCVHTICENKQRPLLVLGTSQGNVILSCGHTHQTLSISACAISCVFSTDATLIVGTTGGEVYTVDTTACTTTHLFIGACSCAITCVHRHEDVLIAGIRHTVAGNGHTCAAVAWNMRTQTRLSSFGRARTARSSSALPPAPTLKARLSAHRAALLQDGRVRVFDLRAWRCIVHARFGARARDVAMDEARLALAGDDGVHVLDFEHALSQWPHQLPSFSAS